MLLEAWRTFEADTVAAEQRQVSHTLQLLPVAAPQKLTDTMGVHTQLKQSCQTASIVLSHPCCFTTIHTAYTELCCRHAGLSALNCCH